MAEKLHFARNTLEVYVFNAVPVVRFLRALLMSCAVVLAAATATAEPLTIDRGFFAAGFSLGVDFVFNTPDVAPNEPAPFVGEGNGTPPAGLAAFFAGARTQAVFNAVFADVIDPSSNSSCPGCSYSGNLTFRLASTVPIPHEDDEFRLPFTMTGAFEGFAPHGGAQVFQHELRGGGFAIIQEEGLDFGFEPSSAPTPEPASALLLLTGVGFAGRRFRRNRRDAQA